MDELEPEVYYKRSLIVLLWIYNFFGLVNFAYNPVTNRAEQCSHRRRTLISVLKCLRFSSLVVTFFGFTGLAVLFKNIQLSFTETERILHVNRFIFMIFNTFIFTISYFAFKGTFPETINQIIRIYERVRKLTNDSLYYPGRFRKLIVLRIVFFVASGILQSRHNNFLVAVALFLFHMHSFALMELTSWAHFYGNLTLMCFYLKMSTLLSNISVATSMKRLKRHVREVVSISYEIHRVKKRFNHVFASLHVMCFFGFLTEISCLYELLKLLLIVDFGTVHLTLWKLFGFLFLIVWSGFWASYNLSLNGYLADALVEAEKIFRRKLLMVFYANDVLMKDPRQHQEIELVLMHHNILDLTMRAHKLFAVRRRFLVAFIRRAVVAFAVVLIHVSDFGNEIKIFGIPVSST